MTLTIDRMDWRGLITEATQRTQNDTVCSPSFHNVIEFANI